MKEYLKEQLERTNYWLSFSEAKNGALVAVNVGVIAVCVQMKSVFSLVDIMVCVLFLVSTLFCLLSFNTNLTNKYKSKENTGYNSELNLSFYGDIARIQNVEEYLDLVKERYHLPLDHEQMCYDLAEEVMINSKIAIIKFNLFKRAVFTDIFAVLVLMIGIILA